MIANPNILEVLSLLDYIVISLAFLITFAFVIYGNLKKPKVQTAEESYLDLLLMGRKLTLPMFVMTLVATWYGGILGVSKIAFDNGIFNFVSQGFFWYLTYVLFALFIIKKISKFEALTLPDLIGEMFGPKSKKLSAVFNILNLIPIVYTISLGLLIQMITNLDSITSMLIGIGFVVIYSIYGGFRAVVYSDIFQFFIMMSCVVMVIIFSYSEYQFIPFNHLPSYYFSPLGKFTLLETLAWGLIALSTLVDPNFYQRCFAANSFKTAKKGILISTCVWICFDLCLTFGAIYAKSIIPDAPSEYGYLYYAIQLLPSGLKGLFIAGIIATIVSTLDSYIFLSSTTVTHDLLPKKYRYYFSTHVLTLLIIAALSILIAIFFDGNIKAVWKTLGSISSASLLLPVLYGHISKHKLSDLGFVTSSMCGAIATIYWRLSGLKYQMNLDEIYIGISASFCSILIFRFTKKSLH